MLILLLLLVFGNENQPVESISENEINYLQDNFFASLKVDPRLQDNVLTKEKKDFIDEQVDKFIGLTKRSQGVKKNGRQKRSFPIEDLETLSKDKYGVYILDSIEEKFALESTFAKDIVVFPQNDEWFAATLENDEGDVYANKLRFYQKFGKYFQMIYDVDVNKAVKMSLYTTTEGSFVAVAENRTENDPKSKILLLRPDRVLEEVQMLNANYVSDILIWEQNDEMFLAVSQQMQIKSNQTIYDTTTIVYKWLGGHFDIVQELPTYNAQNLAINIIGNANFLAVANKRNDRGASNIFSEIFKYDLDSQQFLPHQKIATKSASDVAFFTFVVEKFRETFLIVANYYDEESNEEAKSIIYKYVDDYFIPFQCLEIVGVTGWLPAAGPNGEFVLLASSVSDGIKIFQYDGWRFIESKVQRNDAVFGPGVTSMHSVVYNKKVLIAIANQYNDGVEGEIFQLNFVHRNMRTEYHEKTLSWCKSALSNLQMEQMEKEVLGQAIRDDMSDNVFDAAFGEWQQFNSSDYDEDLDFRLTVIESNLDTQNTVLQHLDIALLKAIHPTFTGNVFAKNVIINKGLFVKHLFVNQLNDVNMNDFLADVLTLNGFHTEKTLYFEDLTLKTPLNPLFINNMSAENLLHASDDLKFKHINVDGKAIFEAPIVLRGTLNNITIDNQTILLQEGDQYLQGQLKANDIYSNDFETRQINEMDLRLLNYLANKPLELENIQTLTVESLTLLGLINDVDIAVLDEFALKVEGDQEITAKYSFGNLTLNDLQTNQKLGDDFVKINGGEYWIENGIHFTNIFAKSVQIKNGLNHIKADKNGQLDLLLRNTPKVQSINGFKEIKAVRLGDVNKLRGKILSQLLEKINPVRHIRKPLELKDDYVFKKGVIFERLQANDITSKEGAFSIERLRRKGLKLNDKNFPFSVDLLQPIKANNVNAEKINRIDADAFVVTGTDTIQIIAGSKIIRNDLYITNSTKTVNINNIHLKQLEHTTLRLTGSQLITGKMVFANLTAREINTNVALLGDKLWSNVLTTDQNQVVLGKTILKYLKTNSLESKSLACKGNINNVNFNSIVKDTIKTFDTSTITSRKVFTDLTIDKLYVRRIDELQELTDFIQLFDNTILSFAQIENLTFSGTCNKISNENFTRVWSLQIDDNMNFENVTVLGALQIDSDYINTLKIDDLAKKTVKLDESFHFESAIFDDALISAEPILLKGQMQGVDLDELSSDRWEKASVFNEINVKGQVVFGGLVSGFNTSELCSFASANNGSRTLIIEGSARIKNNLKTKFVNKYDIETIKNNAWFKNKPTRLSGYFTFDKMHFNDSLSCSGYVGGIRLDYLAKNYFSRTADQNISASLEFVDVAFQNGVTAPKVNLTGNVNDLDLREFLETVLLDGMDQIFEQTPYLDECYIKNLQGEYLVNDMDLQTEVLRYDAKNIVTGLKQISNLEAKTLKTNDHTLVQNVPLKSWIKEAVLKTGMYNITGQKIINGRVQFKKGLHVHGPFNGVLVDKSHTMLKSKPQIISGHKTFIQTGSSDLISFKNIDLSGKLNGIQLNEFLKNQVFKSDDSVIDSPVNFVGNVTAINVNFDKKYNGINVTEFVKKATHFAEFNNIEEAFQNLLNVAHSVTQSLKNQAYYLSTYKTIKHFYYQVYSVIPVLFTDGINRLAAVYSLNDTSVVVFYVWDPIKQTFVATSQKTQYPVRPFYTTALNYPGRAYFYIEGYNNEHKEYQAIISQYVNDSVSTHFDIHTEQARSLSCFTLPYSGEKCYVVVFAAASPATIVCNVFSATPEIFAIDSNVAIKAIAITIENMPYIITINLYSQREESSMNLFKYDVGMRRFYLVRTVYVAQPNDVVAVSYKGVHYVAVSSGHVPNTMHTGSIEIYRYDPRTSYITHHQSINVNAPIQVEFAVLPSQELLLYALTESSTQPLIIYEYSGVSGFTQKIVASGIGKSVSMKQFTTADREHFLVLRLVSDVVLVLRAVFRGQQYEE